MFLVLQSSMALSLALWELLFKNILAAANWYFLKSEGAFMSLMGLILTACQL